MRKLKLNDFFKKEASLATIVLGFAAASCSYVGGGELEEPSPASVHFMDVGQGLAVLLEYDGRYAMYDTGPDSVGVIDSLRSRGIDTLEWVVLSHYHRDHAGGFLEFGMPVARTSLMENASRVHVRRLFVGPDTAVGFVRDSVLRLAFRYGIPVDTLTRGKSLSLGTGDAPRIEVLWPPDYVRVGGNGASLVLDVRYGAASVLLPGDLDSAGERRLLELSPTLDAGLMQVGHHGSAGSSSLKFVSQVSPEYAVVSVGEGNSYGHPANSTLQKFVYVQGDSARFFRTDRDGSVTFELYENLGVVKP